MIIICIKKHIIRKQVKECELILNAEKKEKLAMFMNKDISSIYDIDEIYNNYNVLYYFIIIDYLWFI